MESAASIVKHCFFEKSGNLMILLGCVFVFRSLLEFLFVACFLEVCVLLGLLVLFEFGVVNSHVCLRCKKK
eukprot:UN00034